MIYMLAFDHRSSFSRDLLGIRGTPSAADAARVSDLKQLVFEGFEAALADGVDARTAGLLVDEQYGAGVARSASALGVTLAMPVERSGQAEFEPEFGDAFGRHIEAFDPTYAKVLVRYSPLGDAALNARQAERLAALSQWLRDNDRRLLFELLVPPEPEPDLVVGAMAELQAAGVEPHIWKIEGLEYREDCERAAVQARIGGRDDVQCIVLGRGANEAKVFHWLRQAAGVDGYAGFAVGRTLWWDALSGYVRGSLDRDAASTAIARNYARMVEAFESCLP